VVIVKRGKKGVSTKSVPTAKYPVDPHKFWIIGIIAFVLLTVGFLLFSFNQGTLSGQAGSTGETTICGDIDGDGDITPADQDVISQSLINGHDFTQEEAVRADVNQDGTINEADINLLTAAVSNPSFVLSCYTNKERNLEAPKEYQKFYQDNDGDKYGGTSRTMYSLSFMPLEAGGFSTGKWTLQLGDCLDARRDINPDGTEVCGDGLDNDCNGLKDCEESICSSLPECSSDPQVQEDLNPSCGNGVLASTEQCDDGNRIDGKTSPVANLDGCGRQCEVEPGWVCAGSPSVCTIMCGDVDLDGDMDKDDEQLIRELSWGRDGFTDDQKLLADVDGNRQVTRQDVESLQLKNFKCQVDQCTWQLWYKDNDNDGYGFDDSLVDNVNFPPVWACAQPSGYAPVGDCNDNAANIKPGAKELRCTDARFDMDCDGLTSCDDPDCSAEPLCSTDEQVAENAAPRCGNGILASTEQCDDGNTIDAGTPGGVLDGCDRFCEVEPGWECSGEPSTCTPTCGDVDLDGDIDADDETLARQAAGGQVTLTNEQIKMSDVNGDGVLNDGESIGLLSRAIYGGEINCPAEACELKEWYKDFDNDSWGTDTYTSILSCEQPPNYAPLGDCDDSYAEYSPDAPEQCEGINFNYDFDCDGLSGCDDPDCSHVDKCSEDPLTVENAVPVCGNGIKAASEQCDDGNRIDFGTNPVPNLDGCDRFCEVEPGWECVEDATGKSSCSAICGDVDLDGDIDDEDKTLFEDMFYRSVRISEEQLRQADLNGDQNIGMSDVQLMSDLVRGGGAVSCSEAVCEWKEWYWDADDDGYGDSLGHPAAEFGCVEPELNGDYGPDGDCQPQIKSIYPGALESCNSLDDDCDGEIDEGNACTGIPSTFKELIYRLQLLSATGVDRLILISQYTGGVE
jgi:cysteine-rich repeat protein